MLYDLLLQGYTLASDFRITDDKEVPFALPDDQLA